MGFTPPPWICVYGGVRYPSVPNLLNTVTKFHAREAHLTKQAAFGYNKKTPAATAGAVKKNVGRAKGAAGNAPRQRAGSRRPRKAFTPATRFPPLVKHFVRQPTAR